MWSLDPAIERGDCHSVVNLVRRTRTERESRSVMTPVGLPGAMAASELNPAPNRDLVGIFKIGGRGVEVDVRPTMVNKEGEVANISLGRRALGCGGSG